MWRAMVVVAVIVSGCRSQGEPKPVGPGPHVINAKDRSQGDALAEVYEEASEKCPDGYRIIDRGADSNSSYFAVANSVHQVKRSEVTIVIMCDQPGTAPTATVSNAPWWCAASADGSTSACQRELVACQQYRQNMAAGGYPLTNCAPSASAFCFAQATTAGIAILSCSVNATGCRAWHDFVVANLASGTAKSDCAEQH